MEWLFDGIGTEIVSIVVSLIIGALGGGAVGYKIGIKRTAIQKQSAGNDSEQKQELYIGEIGSVTNVSKNTTGLKQVQKAGDGSVQTQIGGIRDDRR